MSEPDPYAAIRRALLGEASVTSILLPQAALPTLAAAPIFALEYPRKVTGAAATGYTGHDWAALLQARLIKMLLVSPSGRAPSGGDTSRALWGRPRFDLLSYGQTYAEAAKAHWAAHAFLKDLSRVRATLSTGTALIHDCAIEGGPIAFTDPDTDTPVLVGIYAASVAEEFVVVA